jgi:hypothetical protein
MILFLAIAIGLVSLWLIVQAIRPLVERTVVTAQDWERMEDESIELLNRRDRLVAELRDLEFEAALDKISARDMRDLRVRYEAEALDLSRRLDEGAAHYSDRIAGEVDRAGRAGAASRAARMSVDSAAGRAAGEAVAVEVDGEPAAARGGEAQAREAQPVALTRPDGVIRPDAPASPSAMAPGPSLPDGQLACVRCASAIPADAAFCDHCGAPQARPCPECGTSNRATARFCKGCGHALRAEDLA